MRVGLRTVTRLRISGVGLLAALLALPAYAHNNRADLAFYGGFGPSAARCQRIIAKASEACTTAVVAARSQCMSAQVDGQSCDTAAVDAAAQVARRHAHNLIQEFCTDQDAQALQFNNLEEALVDATSACGDAETAATSATYGPVMLSGSVGSLDATARTCVSAAGREGERLMRLAMRMHRRLLDRIVADELPPSTKQLLLERATRRIQQARAGASQRLEAVCSGDSFAAVYGRSVGAFLDGMQQRADCVAGSTYVQAAVTCPAPVCGNGIQEAGEACDDGNSYDSDGCHNDCTKNNCQVFASTFDLIQQAIFENHGCTNDLCHGSARQGGLDLRRGSAYANLVDAQSQASPLKRVEPGDEDRSLLWLKLTAVTLKRTDVPGSPMPLGLPPLSEGELEAMRLWIYSGAPERAVVRGTAELLNACLPAPEPIQIRPPDPPAPGSGVQLHMAPWVLPGSSESEVCFASYYDFTNQVPPQFLSADGTKFRFNRQETTQNPLSHHLVTQFYKGEYPPDDPTWGTYACRGGGNDGQPCDPTTVGACGDGAECATIPVKSVACIGFGPPDTQINISSLGFGGVQETVAQVIYPDGVYAEIPVKGVIMWNSHAFNLSDQAGTIEAWINFYFAAPVDQRYPEVDVLDVSQVFGMHVPAFETQEICNVHAIEDGARLFSLSSHMHQRGKRFRIFRGAFRCAGGGRNGQACSPLSPEMCPDATCVETTGRDPSTSLMYTSLIYNDPAVLRFDPPLGLSGSDADRSFTYCALYDNGFTDPSTVKRKSTSPLPPVSAPGFGGPCAVPTNCVAGKLHAACSGVRQAQRDASCDSSPGAGDGFCDACLLTGGVTTDDEMFVLLGSYYKP
jgi:cysteine-rich repeat protein